MVQVSEKVGGWVSGWVSKWHPTGNISNVKDAIHTTRDNTDAIRNIFKS